MYLDSHKKHICEGQSPNDDEESNTFEELDLGAPETPSRNTNWATNFNKVPMPVLRLGDITQNQVLGSGSLQEDNESEFSDIDDSDDGPPSLVTNNQQQQHARSSER